MDQIDEQSDCYAPNAYFGGSRDAKPILNPEIMQLILHYAFGGFDWMIHFFLLPLGVFTAGLAHLYPKPYLCHEIPREIYAHKLFFMNLPRKRGASGVCLEPYRAMHDCNVSCRERNMPGHP